MVAVLVVGGYLMALGSTSSGQGWRLLSHLVSAHGAVPPAPVLVPEADVGLAPVLRTLRPSERHSHEGGHAHSHGPTRDDHAHDGPVPFGEPVRTVRARTEDVPEGVHEHDGTLHSHDAPAPETPVVVTVSLDRHHLPTPVRVPRPPPPCDADLGDPRAAHPSVDLSVETPPPIRRG